MNLACKGIIDLFYLIWFVLQFKLKTEGWSHLSSIGEMTWGHRGTKLNEQGVSSSEEARRKETFSSGVGPTEGSVFLLPSTSRNHISPGRKQTTTTQWNILASPSIWKQYPSNCWRWCSAKGGPELGDVAFDRSPYKSAGQKERYLFNWWIRNTTEYFWFTLSPLM